MSKSQRVKGISTTESCEASCQSNTCLPMPFVTYSNRAIQCFQALAWS